MPKSSKAKLAYQKAYNAQPAHVAEREANNAARREALKEDKVHKGDHLDVAHLLALHNGGTNAPSNLRVQTEKQNRGWRKGSGSYNPDKSRK